MTTGVAQRWVSNGSAEEPADLHAAGATQRWLASTPGRLSVAAVLTLELALIAYRYGGGLPLDLKIYVWGGHAVGQDGGLYSTLAYDHWFTYPPFAAAAFSPLAALPAWVVQALWPVVSLGALVLGVVACLRLARWPAQPPVVAAVVAAALALEPVRHTFNLGQVNLILFALVMVDIARVASGRSAGVGIGLATAVKLTPGIFILLLLGARHVRAAAVATVTFLACAAVGFVVAPAASTRYWLHLPHDTSRVGAPYISNQSPYGALSRLTGGKENVGTWYVAIPLVLLVLCLVVAVWHARRHQWLEAVAVAGIGSVLVSPISWTHHWTWTVPALIVLLRRGGRMRLAAVAGYVVLVAAPMWWTPHHGGPQEYGLHGALSVLANSFLVAGLAFLAFMTFASTRPVGACTE
jgi:alpha-1,2-mannosyltransferase